VTLIRPVDIPSSPEVAKQASPAPADQASGQDFASVHAAAVARETTAAAPVTAPEKTAAAPTTPAAERIDAPEGETWAATKAGAHYAKIVDGPRKGEYINLSHGARRGQTFTIEQRNGKTVHVYGSGSSEVVVQGSVDSAQVSRAARRAGAPKDQPRAGERWEPVAGHSNYADILGGARNGLFVNISGGVRDGMAFQIVHKGGKVFHVYGTGKHQQSIEVAAAHKKATHSSSSTTTGSSSSSSTGSSAASGTGGTPSSSG
jgi:hypothetical protein